MSIEYRPTMYQSCAIAAGQLLGSLLLIGALACAPEYKPVHKPAAIVDQRSLFDPIQSSSIEELLIECRGKEGHGRSKDTMYWVPSKSRIYEM